MDIPSRGRTAFLYVTGAARDLVVGTVG